MPLIFVPTGNILGSDVAGDHTSGPSPATVVVTLTPADSSPWPVPDGVTSIQVECWGSGGLGGSSTPVSGSGGGGGEYARSVLAVTPATTIPFNVDPGGNAGQTTWGSGPDVIANSGTQGDGVTTGVGGVGGIGGTGDVTFPGGNGGNGGVAAPGGGAGGGASAGNTMGGGNAEPATSATPTAGAPAPPGGGHGGNGGISSAKGSDGATPGGGGGGNGDAVGPPFSNGGDGQIVITYAL